MPNSKNIRTSPETQDKSRWTPPTGTLGALVAAAEVRAARLLPDRDSLERASRSVVSRPSFEAALRRSAVALIAEVKRASPSKGSINAELDPVRQATAYETGGAAAISVLTEPENFRGSNEDLTRIAAFTRLPILKKDFHVDPIQLIEARAIGASAALLIARALAPDRFQELVATADDIGLEILAEVRTTSELELALTSGCRMIGVNNRNLETLEIDPKTAESIIPQIPPDCIAIAESGYSNRESIEQAAKAGADAVLIGSFLSAAGDVTATLHQLTQVPRIGRGR